MDANVVRANGFMTLPFIEVVRKDDTLYQADYFLHLFHRGEWGFRLWHHTCLLFHLARQLTDITFEYLYSFYIHNVS